MLNHNFALMLKFCVPLKAPTFFKSDLKQLINPKDFHVTLRNGIQNEINQEEFEKYVHQLLSQNHIRFSVEGVGCFENDHEDVVYY
jgi:uncharacterized protein (UPF0216 family)